MAASRRILVIGATAALSLQKRCAVALRRADAATRRAERANVRAEKAVSEARAALEQAMILRARLSRGSA